MTDWIMQNSELVQLGLDVAMTLVWLVYLHVIVQSFRRQRRADIHISFGAGGNWFVSNLGLEPIFIADIFAETETDEGSQIFQLSDRISADTPKTPNPVKATNHGPLKSGGFSSICSGKDLIRRIRASGGDPAKVSSVTISILAETAATENPVGAARTFRSQGVDESLTFSPQTIRTRQIKTRSGIRRLVTVVKKHNELGYSGGVSDSG